MSGALMPARAALGYAFSRQLEGELPMRRMHPVLAASALSLVAFTALMLGIHRAHAQKAAGAPDKNGANSNVVVPIKTSAGGDAGTATFSEGKNGVNLTIKLALKGLPVGEHAVHIHANPVCDAPDFKGAGGHFNPEMKQHGMDNPLGHHAGDLPQNVTIGEDHTGEVTYKVKYLSLGSDPATSVLGHSIMIHEKADDMKTDPTGNAGNRIACGVIAAPAM
jgi:superoxide dismutase, Cu-Zn family